MNELNTPHRWKSHQLFKTIRVLRKSEGAKAKDIWDKAAIVSGFLSSVVIAAVGILINISIQNAQLASSDANSKAQIEVAEKNNRAQLTLTERNADIQKHLQEGTLTGQFVEHLTSNSAVRRQLAIVVLGRSIPPEMYQDVITTIVKSDPDAEVRRTALLQARTLKDTAPNVARAIASAAFDASRSSEERELASGIARQLGLALTATVNTFVLSAGLAMESDDLKAGPFTYFLVKGLSGEASANKDGNIRLSDLANYINAKQHHRNSNCYPRRLSQVADS
jgi:hypothetical protein